MSVSRIESISMLAVCEIFSKTNTNGISSDSMPDDALDLYIDFLDELSYDWINDEYLQQLCENVFERKGTESE